MTIFTVRPSSDAAVASFTPLPAGTHWGNTSDNTNTTRTETNNGATGGSLQLGMANLAISGLQKVKRVRLRIKVAIVAGAVTWDAYITDPVNGIVWDSQIAVPGNPLSAAILDDGGLSVSDYIGPWVHRDAVGALWTDTIFNSCEVAINGKYQGRVYEVYLDADVVNIPLVNLILQGTVSKFHTFRWNFVPNGDGSQKKYRVKVFTDAVATGGGFNPETSPAVADSGIIASSRSFHNFDILSGVHRTSPFVVGGLYWVYVTAAKDFNGTDYWSFWYNDQFTIGSDPVVNITAPTGTITDSSPSVVWTWTDLSGKSQASVEARIYETPVAGWTGFDPDATDEEPVWEATLTGTGLSLPVTYDLPNGTYRAYAQGTDLTFGDPYGWVFEDFTVNAPVPDPATVVAMPDINRAAVDLRMRWWRETLPTMADALCVERRANFGDWEQVRNGAHRTGALSIGTALPGVAGVLVRTTNKVGFDVADLDFTAVVTNLGGLPVSTLTLGARGAAAGNKRSWVFQLFPSGQPQLQWSTDGITFQPGVTSLGSVPQSVIDALTIGIPVHFKVTLKTSNPWQASIYYSLDDGATYTLFTQSNGAGVGTNIFNSGANGFVEFGGNDSFFGAHKGLFVRAMLRSSINGPIVMDMDGRGRVFGVTSWNDGLGNVIDIVGANASLMYEDTMTDYEAPFNARLEYRVRAAASLTSGENTLGLAGQTSEASLPIQQVWIKDPSNSSLNRRYLIADSWIESTKAMRRNVQHALGRRLPVVVKGTGDGESFDATFTMEGTETIDNMLALIDSGDTLLLQSPKRQWYVDIVDSVALRDHIFDMRSNLPDLRQVTIPFQEVEMPEAM